MTEVAIARINTFGPSPKAGFESPSDQLIVLSCSQLHDLIREAIQPLQDEISQLSEEIDQDRKEIADLRAKLTSLESTQEKDTTRICLDIAYDRKRITKLEHKEPGQTEINRSEKIEKYLESRPDHKATFETLKGMLQINNVLLNQAIKTLMNDSPGRYCITKAQGDKRKRTLIMLPR